MSNIDRCNETYSDEQADKYAGFFDDIDDIDGNTEDPVCKRQSTLEDAGLMFDDSDFRADLVLNLRKLMRSRKGATILLQIAENVQLSGKGATVPDYAISLIEDAIIATANNEDLK